MREQMAWSGPKAPPPYSGLEGEAEEDDDDYYDFQNWHDFWRWLLTPWPPYTPLLLPPSSLWSTLRLGPGISYIGQPSFDVFSLAYCHPDVCGFAYPTFHVHCTHTPWSMSYPPFFSLQLLSSNGRIGADMFAKEVKIHFDLEKKCKSIDTLDSWSKSPI